MDLKSLDTISFSEIEPALHRKSLAEVTCFLRNFEECIQNYDPAYPFSILHYAFIFRRFDAVCKIKNALSNSEWVDALHFAGPDGYEWITPLVCARWNMFYLYGYDSKSGTSLAEELDDMMEEIYHIDEVMEYTDIVEEDSHKTVFDIFWGDRQPLLDVIYYPKQELASKQVETNNISLVMDEVGTGKTVSAIYAIRNVIEKCRGKKKQAHILVVCPYNKREDWQNDIRRQLGRYAHIVGKADNGNMYDQGMKRAFFKQAEEIIMISGQKGGGDGIGPYTELKSSMKKYSYREKWDLVVIDEGHIAFGNYSEISGKAAMILTATPIVVNAAGRRTFENYLRLLRYITGTSVAKYEIKPIENYFPDQVDVFVNWFKEDMGIKSAERNIRFVPCKRAEERHMLYHQICNEKKTLTALQYDQDDEYLFSKYNECFPNQHKKVDRNYKLDTLVDLLSETEKSYIIFCEHQFVVDLIYSRLKSQFTDVIVAEKYGVNENQYGLENVQAGQLIDTLIQAIRDQRRVLFVTTGKTGGTGLNLGEFDGIIHYELPFTSIELEQRFGRVDRIDTKQDSKERDMIFMLNECAPDQNDNEMNRMLYYCTTKIDITCLYMPIRNTVLYYPEFIKRNGEALKQSLLATKDNEVLSIENERRVKSYKTKTRKFESKIKEDPLYSIINPDGKSVHKSVENALRSEQDTRITDDFYALLAEYDKYWEQHKKDINLFDRESREFRELRKQVENWLAIIGLCDVDNEDEIMTGYPETEDYDDREIPQTEEKAKAIDDEEQNKGSIQKQISRLIEMIDRIDFEHLKLKGFSSDGIFCFRDKRICRSTVEAYRDGKGWFKGR